VVVTLSVTRQRAFRRRHPGTQTRRVALTSCAHPRREDALRGNPDRRRARTPSTKATTPSAVGLPAAAPRQHAGTYSRQSIRRRALAASCKESVCRARDCGGQTHGPFLSGPAAGAGRSFAKESALAALLLTRAGWPRMPGGVDTSRRTAGQDFVRSAPASASGRCSCSARCWSASASARCRTTSTLMILPSRGSPQSG
jgi:hypothetical protein